MACSVIAIYIAIVESDHTFIKIVLTALLECFVKSSSFSNYMVHVIHALLHKQMYWIQMNLRMFMQHI